MSLFSLLSKSIFSRANRKKRGAPSQFVYRNLSVILTRKPYQRSIRFYVKAGSVIQVSCALNSSQKEITSALESHWKWIQKQCLEQQALKRKYPEKTFCEGESFLFQGKNLKLKYEKTPDEGMGWISIKNDNLVYYWNHSGDLCQSSLKTSGFAEKTKEENFCGQSGLKTSGFAEGEKQKNSCTIGINKEYLKQSLLYFYEQEGKKQLREALLLFSSRMRLAPKSVRMGSQKSLWGSCSSKGAISLNWRLIAAPPLILNYVVIHELAHLKHLNHSPAFWALVSRFCPEYKKCENWLRCNVHAMDFLLPHSELHTYN